MASFVLPAAAQCRTSSGLLSAEFARSIDMWIDCFPNCCSVSVLSSFLFSHVFGHRIQFFFSTVRVLLHITFLGLLCHHSATATNNPLEEPPLAPWRMRWEWPERDLCRKFMIFHLVHCSPFVGFQCFVAFRMNLFVLFGNSMKCNDCLSLLGVRI